MANGYENQTPLLPWTRRASPDGVLRTSEVNTNQLNAPHRPLGQRHLLYPPLPSLLGWISVVVQHS